ncbi:MAG: hypothetical protein RIF33_05880 [Cyclobacteriaceae bacterium]
MNHLTQEQIYGIIENAIPKENLRLTQEHLDSCEVCQLEVKLARLLISDIQAMEVPEANPGFALRISQRINARELERAFTKPIFRLFRGTLLLSLFVAVAVVVSRLSDYKVDLPEIEITGGLYYIIAIACLSLIYLLDKVLSKQMK